MAEVIASVVLARCFETGAGSLRWHIRLDAGLVPNITIAVRMDELNERSRDYYVLPEAGVPTKTHVLNLLHRLVDGKTIDGPPLDTPQALILKHEPKANVARYDGLRAMIEGDRHAS